MLFKKCSARTNGQHLQMEDNHALDNKFLISLPPKPRMIPVSNLKNPWKSHRVTTIKTPGKITAFPSPWSSGTLRSKPESQWPGGSLLSCCSISSLEEINSRHPSVLKLCDSERLSSLRFEDGERRGYRFNNTPFQGWSTLNQEKLPASQFERLLTLRKLTQIFKEKQF